MTCPSTFVGIAMAEARLETAIRNKKTTVFMARVYLMRNSHDS